MTFSFIPNKHHHTIEIPLELYGKEVTIEIKEKTESILPNKDKTSDDILSSFGSIKDFPSIEDLRKQTAPRKW